MTKREQILESSLQLFAEQGVQATPMSQIVAESGVATGTIYHHFKSKQEIIEAIYLAYKKEFGQLFQSAVNESASVKAQFESIWKAVFNFYIEAPLKYRFSQQIAHSHYIDDEVRLEGASYYQGFCDFFEAGIKDGVFAQMELYMAMELVHNSICTLANLYLDNKIDQLELRTTEAVQYAWRGIVAPKQKENE